MTVKEAIRILVSCDKKPTWKITAGMIKEAQEIVASLCSQIPY